MQALRPLGIALQFLTRIPVRLCLPVGDDEIGRSLAYYPWVGLLIGALLASVAAIIHDAPDLLSAALLLSLWVLISGGLHLDGLADMADAWVGGIGDRDKTLRIMKDPNCGPMGVLALMLVLLLKFTALVTVVAQTQWLVLLCLPMLARAAVVVLFLTTPYASAQGLGSALMAHLRPASCWAATALAIGVALVLIPAQMLWVLATITAVFIGMRLSTQQRLQGFTGDTAGALLELTECAALVVVAITLT